MSELLWDALQRPAVVALVGGGGKTTLALRLLGEASGVSKALFTTTTRIRVPQVPADVQALVEASELADACEQLSQAFAAGCRRVGLISRREASPHGERAVGVPAEWIEALLKTDTGPEVCIVEADGSRMLPFKAPRLPSEPVLPKPLSGFSMAVVAVAGVDALGVPLDETHVCRADVVREVAAACLAEPSELGDVTPEVVGTVLGRRELWCHGLEEGEVGEVTFHVAVNKVDSDFQLSNAQQIVAAIRRRGDGVASILVTLACSVSKPATQLLS
ncbi:unnamed protein product [Effrenium voratum]|nr:unnamed protein product [Effrenium voratum]